MLLCHRLHILAVILGWALLPIQCLTIPPPQQARGLLHRRDDRAPDPIDPKIFDAILHYATYAGTYLSAPCKQPPLGAAVVAFTQNDTTATQQTIFRHSDDREVVLAFPGTANPTDIGTDLNFPHTPHPACDGCNVHQGVYEGWLSVAGQTMAQVKTAMQETPDFKFIIIGHRLVRTDSLTIGGGGSLGGGLANLAYVDMQRAGMKVDLVVSFGELAVGNQQYADHVDKIAGASDDNIGMFWRVTHSNDGVPLLPPNALTSIIGQDFIQHRTEFWAQDGPDGETANASTTFRCYGQMSQACNTGQGGIGINPAHVFYPYTVFNQT
ncbi:Lipase- class 3 [Apiospora rasikravindrae]|uniref:Lipase- class 3 n=1 Tax=Apiospora rasikravindrae TaxID=990691 RepID=A0ABR1SKQ6_9PEZI